MQNINELSQIKSQIDSNIRSYQHILTQSLSKNLIPHLRKSENLLIETIKNLTYQDTSTLTLILTLGDKYFDRIHFTKQKSKCFGFISLESCIEDHIYKKKLFGLVTKQVLFPDINYKSLSLEIEQNIRDINKFRLLEKAFIDNDILQQSLKEYFESMGFQFHIKIGKGIVITLNWNVGEKDDKTEIAKEKHTDDQVKFTSIMNIGDSILESEYPSRIRDLIYSLGKELQFKFINNAIKDIENPNERFIEAIFIEGNPIQHKYSFYKYCDGKSLNTYKPRELFQIDPSKNIIFTMPWSHDRMKDAFLSVGENVGSKWTHDPFNHQVTLIKPLNIGLVTNGNHSSAMNIISNESSFTVTNIIDLEPIYKEIYTDGRYFMYKHNDEVIEKARSIEMAAIFELGRKLEGI